MPDIYDELLTVIETKSEEEARRFLVDRFKDLPEELQDSVLVGFFAEGLQRAAAEEEQNAATVAEAADDLQLIAELKRIVEDKLKIKDLEEKLGQ